MSSISSLIAAAVFAGAVAAGCRGSGQPETSPPTATASVAPSETPSQGASSDPGPSQSVEANRFEVPLTIATSHAVTARVVDWTGRVTGAASGTPGDGASVPYDEVRIENDGDLALVVTWVGGPCDQTVTMVLDHPSALTVVQEPCQGDSIGFDRIVRLELREPIAAASIRGVLQPGGDTSRH